MEEIEIYCGIDARDGKLTGSSCRSDDPNYQEWAMIEVATQDVCIEKMGVMQFVEKMQADGFGIEKYISYLESQA